MKLDLIKLTEDNVPDCEVINVIAFGEGMATVGEIYKEGSQFNAKDGEGFVIYNITHFAYIPVNLELSDTNPNQSLIDEYRGLIESMELEVQERKQKLYNRHAVQIHDRLEREYEESKIRLDERKQFITKLEAVK